MFDFARSKGWTNDAGTHLRAHVEYPDRFASDRLVPD